MSTTRAASLMGTTMRRGRHRDPPEAEADNEEEGGARRAATPHPSSGRHHVPILIGRHRITTLVFVFRCGG